MENNFDIGTCREDEVFVDLGAYNGDSTFSFIENFGNYKRIYCYEMAASSMEKIKQKLASFDNIIYRQAAAGNKIDMICMTESDIDSCHTIMPRKGRDAAEHNQVWVPMVRLDDDIQEAITFLKMDIEESELEAMKGAKRHIREDKPKLAICSYHNNHHIYEIPRLMREYNPQYKLYMRYNGDMNDSLASEYVTFAIP